MAKKQKKTDMSDDKNEAQNKEEAGLEQETVDETAGSEGAENDVPEEGADETEKDPVVLLEEKLETAEENANQAHDRLLRATAEFENYKKRSSREAAEFRKFANESLIKELLPVVDNLERAIESSGNDGNSNKGIIEGVEMTLNEIFKVLEKFNLKPLESEGKPFDPNFHQAVLQEETDEYPENIVLKEMQKGYILHDRLIRPAMVVVTKAAANKTNGQVKESAGQADE